ncbi:MAG: cohesin domain-containing protein [Bacteroidales bacterium]
MKTKFLRLLTKVLAFLFITLATSSAIIAQAELSVGAVSSTPGELIAVPVNASGFTGDLNAVTLKLDYDNSILTFTGISLLQPQTGLVAHASGSTLTIVNSIIDDPFQINDGLLLELNFIYNGGGTSNISFKPGTEIFSTDLELLDLILINGSVSSATPPPMLIIGQVYAPEGSSVTVPVTASGFDPDVLVGAITLKIGFPAGVLVSTAITSYQDFDLNYAATSNQMILTWKNPTGKILANGPLVDLKFNYLTSDLAVVKFNPGVIISDINYATIPVQYIDGFVSEMPEGYKVSGLLKYANEIPLTNSTVELWDETETILIESTTTDGSGMYEFIGVVPANYVLKATTTKDVGGIDIDDLWDMYGFLDNGNPTFVGIFALAADINNDGNIDIDDFWDIYNYLDQGDTPAGYVPWIFKSQSIIVSGADISIDIVGICSGDVNASYDPIP